MLDPDRALTAGKRDYDAHFAGTGERPCRTAPFARVSM